MTEFIQNQFMLSGKPLFIYSGEIHYFRIDPTLWPKHLKLAKEAGLNTVASYIPWGWHECEEGHFDFTGKTHPQRNLIHYMELVKKAGLYFLPRVGPVSNAELNQEGLPAWLMKNYPDVYLKRKNSDEIPEGTLLSYLSDTFQKYTGKWYDQVLPLIEAYQHPKGNIIFVQLCNEIGMVHWLGKAADYSKKTETMYRDFLKEKYGSIDALNGKYQTNYESFAQIEQPATGDDSQNRNMLWDWMNFYQSYYAIYFEALYKKYTEKGLRQPVLANIPQFYDFDVRGRGIFAPMTSMMFKDFPKLVPQVVFGGAYQMRRLDYENFHDISITTEVVKMITGPDVPSICAELQTGIMRDRPKLYNSDVELNLKTSMGHGLNGVNCYMFSGGKNVAPYGGFGTYHEWQAVISSDGQKRNHFEAMENFGGIVKTFGSQISSAVKQWDTVIGFYSPYYTTEYLSGKTIRIMEDMKKNLFYDGLARLLQLANINTKFIDLEKIPLKELMNHPSLWVFSLDFMDMETQQKLADYIKHGGKLVINPYLPTKNINQEKCTVLADYIGTNPTQGQNSPLFYQDNHDFYGSGETTVFSKPANAEVVAKKENGDICGYHIKRDTGEILLLGMGLCHSFQYHVDLVKEYAARMGVIPSIEVNKDLQVVLRKNSSYGFLFLENFHDEPKNTKIKMVLPGETGKTSIPAKGDLEIDSRKCFILPLNVNFSSTEKIRYSTAEITGIEKNEKATIFTLRGEAGFQAELDLITHCKSAIFHGKKLSSKNSKGRLRLNFVMQNKTEQLIIR